ncbi:aminoglycoside phosphotransferase family protein [Protofrankia symbiont of Coriaria ruscifolia]|uniref:aminoglycoside phosphotransferase family protein n=1 Tax=Protofrankia symbiont of Coriaria ruscifolia TaxID=1306542 RepID=UPI0032420F32
MAITPRFRRVAALQRPFVDREPVLAAFAEEMARVGSQTRVFNVVGVGGIGKSRLLRELADTAGAGWRTVMLDLQVPALRQHDDALAVLRGELGTQGVRFDRFDIAYAVLWQRLHPHLRLSRRELPFVQGSSILTEIADSVAGVPVFGTAVGLLKIFERTSSDVRRRRHIRHDETLEKLDGLSNSELADAVTYLFAQDLRDASTDTPYMIIVDSYEAMVPAPIRTGRAQLADVWLRDLVGQLDRGLVVIASREPLRWEKHDADWGPVIRVCDIGGLPMQARLELLGAGGIDEPAKLAAIANASAGLPFYLNLAVDMHQQTGGRVSGTLVSPEEILARFLQHVAADEISSLEILSPARTFDYEIFRMLARAFHLPANRVVWESLTAYSFVYPAGPGLRFHQLMRTALRNRLTDGVATDIHLLMRGLWDNRAATAIGAGRARSAHALREAAYHGVRAGQTSGAELLDYTDRAVRWGGHTAAAGMTNDLHAWLTDHTDDDLATTLRCLNTEAAVRLGDASTAIRLTPRQTWAATGAIPTVVGGRLAVAAGQGRRIAGHTAAALTIFTQVWEQGSGTARRTAGLWAADLHMCQGRFTDAEILAAQLDAAQAGADDREFRADVARLRHLAGRFAFDLDASRRYLDEAEAHYTAADSVLGLANIQTNRAELLAMTDPTQAIIEAGRALEIQAEIGAHHELGKAYTALAVGQLRTGRLAEADNSLQSAFTALDRAGYRSGRARAELYQGLLLARLGRLDEAVPSLLRAVAELEAAHVYPTLILAAACALDALGLPQDDVNAAARRARATIQPIGSFEETDRRIAGFVDELLDGQIYRPADLHRQASERADSASGFYNHNVRLSIPAGDVIVRIPIPDTDTMDLSIWPEPTVLRAIRDRVPAAPRLLYATDTYATDTPPFQIHEFKAGELLDNVAPRGVRVPGHVIDDVVELLHILGHVSRQRLPPPAEIGLRTRQRPNSPADSRRSPAGFTAAFSPTSVTSSMSSVSRRTPLRRSFPDGAACDHGHSSFSTPTSTART